LETGSGRDSVRARVTVREVANDSLVAEFDVANASTQMDAVADSIAITSLRQLGKSRSIAAVPRAYFGSRSLPALKYFLQGEQKYRNNDFKAAKVDYDQAIALDSTFALAYRRMRGVLRGITGEFDSTSLWYAARAGAANHGTSLRDSLLILADSLAAVHRLIPPYASGQWIGSVRRRLATLDYAASKYADDPEVWTELGEARVHYGERVGIDDRQSLAAFERALAIDSTYGPAFYHAIDLTMQLRGARAARPLVDRYVSINPHDEPFGLVSGVVRGSSVQRLTAQLDSQRTPVMSVFQLLAKFPDDADVLSTLYAHWLTRDGAGPNAPARRVLLTRRYAFRGRARDAIASTDTATLHATVEGAALTLVLAQTGSISRATASAIFERVARTQNLAVLPLAFPEWYGERDTASLRASAAFARQRQQDTSSEVRGLARYAELSANAYLLLARGDTTGALQTLLQRPDSAMSRLVMPLRLEVARLLLARNEAREAAIYLDARPPFPGTAMISDVQWQLERGRAARRTGDLQRARSCYAVVAAAWNHADAEFQPAVAEARAALRDLKDSAAR
jgi:serine/threonine-protein kinase